jgi:hypothetical protein
MRRPNEPGVATARRLCYWHRHAKRRKKHLGIRDLAILGFTFSRQRHLYFLHLPAIRLRHAVEQSVGADIEGLAKGKDETDCMRPPKTTEEVSSQFRGKVCCSPEGYRPIQGASKK